MKKTGRRVSARQWREATTRTSDQTAELYGVDAPTPPAGYVLVGWTWEHPDGSYGLVRPGEATGHRTQPLRMRPVFAPEA